MIIYRYVTSTQIKLFSIATSHVKKVKRLFEIIRIALVVRHMKGKCILSQIREIVSLRVACGKLSVSEYYKYGLYDDHQFSFSAKREFIG